jgi:hypothetical protein
MQNTCVRTSAQTYATEKYYHGPMAECTLKTWDSTQSINPTLARCHDNGLRACEMDKLRLCAQRKTLQIPTKYCPIF